MFNKRQPFSASHQCYPRLFTEADECANVTCGGQSKCSGRNGNFSCECADGWTGGGENQICENVNECAKVQCGGLSKCVDGENHYTCECAHGWTGGGVDKLCTNINDCEGVECGGASLCIDRVGEFQCECAYGWTGGGINQRCENINDCVDCGGESICEDGLNQFTCNCADGWEFGGVNRTCSSVDDCKEVECGGLSKCVDGHKSFTCECASGWTGGGAQTKCTDVDECDSVSCGVGSKCNDLIGRFQCQCGPGYAFAGYNKECADRSSTCNGEGQEGGLGTCKCKPGYDGIPQWDEINSKWTNPCRDIDECMSIDCGGTSRCINLRNKFRCVCAPGLKKNSTYNALCTDVNECVEIAHLGIRCGGLSECVNGMNSFACECAEGWEKGGKNRLCEDINECKNVKCGGASSCHDHINHFDCNCLRGYIYQGINKLCLPATCDGLGQIGAGSNCDCAAGYAGEPVWNASSGSWSNPCTEIDECKNVECGGDGSWCEDHVNKFECHCGSGLEIDRGSKLCVDIDECDRLKKAGLDCGGPSRCINGKGSFTCECAEGWEGGGLAEECRDIDECQGIDCGGSSTCENEVGKYSCDCTAGWRPKGDNQRCEDARQSCSGIGQVGGEGTCECEQGYVGTPKWNKEEFAWDNPCIRLPQAVESSVIIGNTTINAIKPAFSLKNSIPDSNGMSLMIGIPIVAGIILLVIVATVVVFVRRRRLPDDSSKTRVIVPIPSNKSDVSVAVIDKAFSIPFNQLKLGPIIARGGMGQVRSGYFGSTAVAIKELISTLFDPTATNALMEEASMLCSIHHPNIVRFYGMAIDPSPSRGALYYLVTDLKQTDLRRLVDNEPQPAPTELMRMAAEICAPLAFLHSLSMIHRDVKPENILVDSEGTLFLCDFGVSKAYKEVTNVDMTNNMGTAAYMAPELTQLKKFASDFGDEEDEQLCAAPTPKALAEKHVGARAKDVSGDLSMMPPVGPATQSQVDDVQGQKSNPRIRSAMGHRWSCSQTMRTEAALAAKVDCYSFALVLWVLLKWRLPFRNLSPMQILITVSYYHRRPSIKGTP